MVTMTSARNSGAWPSGSAKKSLDQCIGPEFRQRPVTGNRARIGAARVGSARSGQDHRARGPGSSLPRVAVEPVEDGQPGLCCEAGGERAAHPVRFGSKPHTALTPGSGLPGREALGMKTLAQPPQAGPQLGRSAEPALPRPRVRRSATVENFRPARQAGSGPGRE